MASFKRSAVPQLVHIETTYACNFQCGFCYNPGRAKLGDLDQTTRIVDRVAESFIPHVYLIGGEPSLLGVDRLNSYIEKLKGDSSVTIVTNGYIYLDGIDTDLALIGVPLHGDNKETHEWHNSHPGSWDRVVENIQKYTARGFDVRIIPVLTRRNYDQMPGIIKMAHEWGCRSVYIDKFEEGGQGFINKELYELEIDHLTHSFDAVIEGKKKYPELEISYGTAIPYCLDERIVPENLYATCGAGRWFMAINPDGDSRPCNQSMKVLGNILKQSMEEIWNDQTLSPCLNCGGWMTEPCNQCPLQIECGGGCIVQGSRLEFAPDPMIREKNQLVAKDLLAEYKELIHSDNERRFAVEDPPHKMRQYHLSRYAKLHTRYVPCLVTRYESLDLDERTVPLMKAILKNENFDEGKIVRDFKEEWGELPVRNFISFCEKWDAIHQV